MYSVGDLLTRLRPAGTPGAATAAGVPADRGADLAEELRPVFAALAGTRYECRQTRLAAERAAAETLGRAHERAAAVLARARTDAPAERARAAARVRARGRVDLTGIEEGAAHDIETVRQRAAKLTPALVERIVHQLRADLATMAGAGAPAAPPGGDGRGRGARDG